MPRGIYISKLYTHTHKHTHTHTHTKLKVPTIREEITT